MGSELLEILMKTKEPLASSTAKKDFWFTKTDDLFQDASIDTHIETATLQLFGEDEDDLIQSRSIMEHFGEHDYNVVESICYVVYSWICCH